MKVIYRGPAPPDHPIYRSGLVVGGKLIRGSRSDREGDPLPAEPESEKGADDESTRPPSKRDEP